MHKLFRGPLTTPPNPPPPPRPVSPEAMAWGWVAPPPPLGRGLGGGGGLLRVPAPGGPVGLRRPRGFCAIPHLLVTNRPVNDRAGVRVHEGRGRHDGLAAGVHRRPLGVRLPFWVRAGPPHEPRPIARCAAHAPPPAPRSPPLGDPHRPPLPSGWGRGALEGGGGAGTPTPPSRAPSLHPATVSLTPSASLNGICNRQSPPPTALATSANRLPNRCWGRL